MSAFRLGVEQGAEMIELDVRVTRDGNLVVHHDRRLGRTSDGHGRVRDLSLESIQSVDAGSWFDSRYAGERIPSLVEVLEWLPDGIGLNIEVKTDGDPRPGRLAAEECVRVLGAHRQDGPVMVSSFDHSLLPHLDQSRVSLIRGVIFSPLRDFGESPSELARRAGATVFVCSRSQLRKHHVKDAHEQGLAVACYGVNTGEHLRSVTRHGVDAVMTDFPARINSLLNEG
jgi:glycerophosphoryl diester phosphodiesterase